MSTSDFARARIGSVLSGKWRLDDLLGTGGMACVYSATHQRNRMRVAIKVLHPEIGRNAQLRERFHREGYVANSIKHPGIVQVFDDSADEETVYLVMELLEGATLNEHWKRRSVSGEQAGRVISDVLDVLACAHRAGVIHRDVKPDNIFLTTDGRVKLLDFGIAGVRELQSGNEHMTATGQALGTPAFMSPEQALGRWAEVEARSDLYSTAATAWLLLTGVFPHEGSGVSELLVAAATRQVRPLLSVAPSAPVPVARVIDHALAFRREDRFASADEMKSAWDRAFLEAARGPTPTALTHGPRTSMPRLDEAEGATSVQEVRPQPAFVDRPQPSNAHVSQGSLPAFGPPPSAFVTPAAPAMSAANVSVSSRAFSTENLVSAEMRAPRRGWVLYVAGALALTMVLGAVVLLWPHRSIASRSATAPASATAESTHSAEAPPSSRPAWTSVNPSSIDAASSRVAATTEPSSVPSSSPAPQQKPVVAKPPPRSCPPTPVPPPNDRDLQGNRRYTCCNAPCSGP